MNRKQVLKNVKNKKKEKNNIEEENYFSRLVGILAFTLIIVILGYLFIGIFVNKAITFGKEEDKEDKEVTIDNSTILAGEIFDQKEENYYVLVMDKTDKDSLLSDWSSYYTSKNEGALKVYTVDSSLKLNGKFIVEKDSNTSPQGYDDLKIVSPTLLKIEGKHVSKYIEGEESIKKYLKGEE